MKKKKIETNTKQLTLKLIQLNRNVKQFKNLFSITEILPILPSTFFIYTIYI